jgi:molybdopterin molybdotransferase
MITVLEAQKIIEHHSAPLGEESVALALAHGRILREPVASKDDIPGFDRSAMDGYAVRADDGAEEFEVVGEIRAGQTEDRQLKPGQAIRIFTGARLPGDGLKVVMQEHVEAREGRIRITKRTSNSNVRKRGEDAHAGEVLLEPGKRLDATAVALLASVGKTSIRVSRQPRILHLTTGDEIVPPEQTPESGQIRNSNASLIAGLCREQGVESITHVHAGDDWEKLLSVLTKAEPENYDMILISGGSGGGDYDFSAGLFKHLEATIHFREVNVRPGKPLIFGTAKTIRHPELVEGSDSGGKAGQLELRQGHTDPLVSSLSQEQSASGPSTSLRSAQDDGALGAQIIFGLPGNALSHFVCFQLFVRPALDRMLARSVASPVSGVLFEAMVDTQNARETWWPARAGLKDGRLECRALPWKSSGDITRLPAANALIHVPASTSHFPAGTMVRLFLTQNNPFHVD